MNQSIRMYEPDVYIWFGAYKADGQNVPLAFYREGPILSGFTLMAWNPFMNHPFKLGTLSHLCW